MTSSNFNDPKPEQRWYTQIQLAQDAWAAATNFVKKNRDHVIFNGCSPLDSPTGLNERRIVLFRMTAKKFSDVLGCRFKKQVDDYDDTDEGRLQQKRGRENLKLRMKHALGECKKRLSAVTYTRIVPISGVEHTFQYDPLSDTIHKAVVQYYDAHRHIEAFADVTKEQGLVNLLILPNDQFNNAFDGRFDINAVGFVESKDCVKEYFTKLMEQASTATAPPAPTAAPAPTAPTADEQFQMVMQFMSASTSNTASNIDAVAGCLNAEREERIAGQVQHKALIDQNTIVIGKAHERIDNHDERIGNHDEKIDILERKIEALTPKPKKKRDPTPLPTPTPKKKRAHAQDQAPGSVRRSARKKPTRK
eukprot:scaffold844_cov121-Skeletonema_marinoi.AAC.2